MQVKGFFFLAVIAVINITSCSTTNAGTYVLQQVELLGGVMANVRILPAPRDMSAWFGKTLVNPISLCLSNPYP
jgi:hypothetical protein